MPKLKIAILGIRGIPNHYGGFEQISEQVAGGLAKLGHNVTVYNSHNHPYQRSEWNNVCIVHRFDPEFLLGTAGQFVYDLNCILHARKMRYDVILFMGYTSSSIWASLFPKNTMIISNMDGLEWKRGKYHYLTRKFLKQAERWAVHNSHWHIADSPAIQDYLREVYGIVSKFLPYGASRERVERPEILERYGLCPGGYYLLIARMEPENHVNTILSGFHQSFSEAHFIVVGNCNTRYGARIQKKYRVDKRIIFTGGLFDQDAIYTLRKHARIYFHGHSVGGTNPSLLEAMASQVCIAAHQNPFNKAVLGDDAFYFEDAADIQRLLERNIDGGVSQLMENNYQKIVSLYNWDDIVRQYDSYVQECYLNYSNAKSFCHKRYIHQ